MGLFHVNPHRLARLIPLIAPYLRGRLKEPSSLAGLGIALLTLGTIFPAWETVLTSLALALGVGAVLDPERKGNTDENLAEPDGVDSSVDRDNADNRVQSVTSRSRQRRGTDRAGRT